MHLRATRVSDALHEVDINNIYTVFYLAVSRGKAWQGSFMLNNYFIISECNLYDHIHHYE